MEQDINFIAIEDSKNHIIDFENLMNDTVESLKENYNDRNDFYNDKNGEKLEPIVLQCMKAKAPTYHFDPKRIFKTKRQHFPDIVSNKYYGVEVKTAKDSWTSTGSSIVESLRYKNIEKIYMLFGNISQDKADFKCKPYEEVLYDIAVTHSPRYLINMNLEGGQTIFDKLQTTYDKFRTCGDQQIEIVRGYYRKKYKDKEATTIPWWIGDTTDKIDYNFKLLSDLDDKDCYIARCYALFPEILGTDKNKFRRPVLWMCSRYSIICSNIRDLFTAGGTGNIVIKKEIMWENVPRVICNLLQHIKAIKYLYGNQHADFLFDYNDFSIFSNYSLPDFDEWKIAVNKYIAETMNETSSLTIDNLLQYEYEKKECIDDKDYFYMK